MLVRRWALVAVVALGAGACSGGRDDTPDPTIPTAPPASVSASSTTATAPDVAAIPPVIDEAYLNAVLAALDRVDGDATRLIVAKKDLVPEAAAILNAVYDDKEFEVQAEGWLTTLDKDPELKTIKSPPGDRRTTVARILTAQPRCVFAEVLHDYSETAAVPPPPSKNYMVLIPIDGSNDPRRLNPTPWMVAYDGYNSDRTPPRNPCQP